MCHLDHHRTFPTKKIGCVIWILMSLEAAKVLNESNQDAKPNYQVRRDPCVEEERKSRNVPSLITTLLVMRNTMKSQITSTGSSILVNQTNRYGETRIGESNRGARDCFQSTRTVTCNCKRSRTSPSSRACEKDRKSSSSRSTSCRLAAD